MCVCARACCVCWCVAGGDLSHINIDIPRQNVCVSVCLSISLCQILQSASCWIGIITISFQPSCLPHLSWGDKASVQMNLQADIFMDADAAIPSCSRAQARTPARASECTRTRTYSRTLARTHTRTRTDMHTPRDTHMRARARMQAADARDSNHQRDGLVLQHGRRPAPPPGDYSLCIHLCLYAYLSSSLFLFLFLCHMLFFLPPRFSLGNDLLCH